MEDKIFLIDHRGRKWRIGNAEKIETEKGEGESINFTLKGYGDSTDFFISSLILFLQSGGELAEAAARTLDFLADKLEGLELIGGQREGNKGEVRFRYRGRPGVDVTEEEIKQAINNPAAIQIFTFILSNRKAAEEAGRAIRKGGAIQLSQRMHQAMQPEKERKGGAVEYVKRAQLTATQLKFQRALLSLLRDNSIRDKNSPDYYTGNGPESFAPAQFWGDGGGGEKPLRRPVIVARWADLYKAFTGKRTAEISGNEIQQVKGLLQEFTGLSIKAIWKTPAAKKGKWLVYMVEEPLLKKLSAAELTDSEVEQLESGGEIPESKEILYLSLHAAYIADIKERSVNWPEDYDTRLQKVVGKGGRPTDYGERLRDYLNGVRCGGKAETELNLKTAVARLGLEAQQKKRGKKWVAEAIERELRIGAAVGLIEDLKIQPAAGGDQKFCIRFNPNFAK
jgi:hypothetical protein